MNYIKNILKEYPFVILDGALATELERAGFKLKSRLWSAKLLSENPDAIKNIHLSYLEAGADCITTASYQATIDGFVSEGFTVKEAKKLIQSSVTLALKSIDEFIEKNQLTYRPYPFIAASIGCYGAYLANGSEYSGNYTLTFADYRNFYESRIELLHEAGANFLAFETFPRLDEALAVAEIMKSYNNIHYWISFTAKDKKSIPDGKLFSDCVKALFAYENLAAVGINCSDPEFISSLIEEANTDTTIPIIVYPNSGEIFDTTCNCWTKQERCVDFSIASQEWYNKGARLIGGCCRTTPEDIKKISNFRKRLMTTTPLYF
ncbi:MAG TPA: homocysteine S-methyltransferase [Spirochaetota bacterium]|nr:homocysteine S-methyltransferase [Spirochaetota bacterium]